MLHLDRIKHYLRTLRKARLAAAQPCPHCGITRDATPLTDTVNGACTPASAAADNATAVDDAATAATQQQHNSRDRTQRAACPETAECSIGNDYENHQDEDCYLETGHHRAGEHALAAAKWNTNTNTNTSQQQRPGTAPVRPTRPLGSASALAANRAEFQARKVVAMRSKSAGPGRQTAVVSSSSNGNIKGQQQHASNTVQHVYTGDKDQLCAGTSGVTAAAAAGDSVCDDEDCMRSSPHNNEGTIQKHAEASTSVLAWSEVSAELSAYLSTRQAEKQQQKEQLSHQQHITAHPQEDSIDKTAHANHASTVKLKRRRPSTTKGTRSATATANAAAMSAAGNGARFPMAEGFALPAEQPAVAGVLLRPATCTTNRSE